MKTSMRFDLVDLRLFLFVSRRQLSRMVPRGLVWRWHLPASEFG
jgi:hypothetical protein